MGRLSVDDETAAAHNIDGEVYVTGQHFSGGSEMSREESNQEYLTPLRYSAAPSRGCTEETTERVLI